MLVPAPDVVDVSSIACRDGLGLFEITAARTLCRGSDTVDHRARHDCISKGPMASWTLCVRALRR